jgi:hypothetical protein
VHRGRRGIQADSLRALTRNVDLHAILVAHPYLRVERPPLLWEPDADDESFVRLLGEMIAAGLVRNGGELASVTLNVSNVTVAPDAADPLPAGDFVAITIKSSGDWSPELARRPTATGHPPLVNADLEAAALRAEATYAYTRMLGPDEGSVTVFFTRR